MYRLGYLLVVVLGCSFGAFALTGSGDSASGALETISPSLESVSAASETSLSATSSEPMRAPGVTTPGHYAASGAGAGTLTGPPSTVSGTGPYTLTWALGEMRNGQSVTATATGLQDAVGNPIDPAHDSASCTGLGVAPVFSDLEVDPVQAGAGDTVRITFTVSEAVGADPTVTVNGREAMLITGGKSLNYAYAYVVQESDALGMAAVQVSGADPAGNGGTLSAGGLLEIVEAAPDVPLRAWPIVAALLGAGLLLLAWRRTRTTALLLVLMLAASAAFADPPTVPSVTFTQSPNGTTGTQVDIDYDLVAPNGACGITVSLSKNGGADGFIYPAVHCTGDVANRMTGPGHIVWDIRADYPEENIPNARIRVTADDAPVLV